MAEGFGKAILGNKYNFFSAGTKKHGMNQIAIKVMSEVGIDLSTHESKTTEELPTKKIDFIFTVCSDAHENCPYFPGGKTIHTGFDDPPRITKDMTNEDEILYVYRRVRDEIKEVISNLEQYLSDEE